MSMTHKYIPRIQQREENLFLEEYYSGTDTKVYLNDNEQTEISYISFSLNEQLKPIYGYASRTFDDMSVGNRIVTGIFRMPIKNPEEQTPYEEVVKPSTLEEIENNNRLEQDKKNNTEWIDNFSTNQNTLYPDNSVLEYQNKLKALGYEISNTGFLDSQTVSIIKKFQTENNNLQITGRFDNDTMAQIDFKVDMKNMPLGTVEGETDIYAGLSTKSGLMYTVYAGEQFYLIQDLGDFTQVRTIDGTDGFIETSRIVEV